MARHDSHLTSVFGQTNPGSAAALRSSLHRAGLARSEWWLNVDYAEVIEFKDAIGINTIRARLAR